MDMSKSNHKNPKRVAAGRENVKKRRKRVQFSEDAIARLRQAAYRNRPWEFSTGPKTKEGKRRAAGDGRPSQLTIQRRLQIFADLTELMLLIEQQHRAEMDNVAADGIASNEK